ncbi:MAG: hypothetical protein RIC15_11775 [Vicingaceae bacterium]
MNKSEAEKILKLSGKYELEELKRAYLCSFVNTFRKSAAAVTIMEMEQRERELKRINSAYFSLNGNQDPKDASIHFDFEPLTVVTPEKPSEKNLNIQEQILDLLSQQKHTLCIRLLEQALLQYNQDTGKVIGLDRVKVLRLLGKTLIQIGMINKGMPLYNMSLLAYEKAKNMMAIGDYRSALHYFGKELNDKETKVPFDEICEMISICYFLSGDYENALSIVENVLPGLMPKRQIFSGGSQTEKYATVLLICIYRSMNLEGGSLDQLKIRVKYPLAAKYLQNCYGKISEAIKIVDDFENNPESYDRFMDSLKPANPVREQIELSYELDDLQIQYLAIFGQPMKKSLIYNPK